MKLFKKNEKKETTKLPMTGKVRKGFRFYCVMVMAGAMVLGTSMTAFAASDPLTVGKRTQWTVVCCTAEGDTETSPP